MELTLKQLTAIMPRAKKKDAVLWVKDFKNFKWLHKMDDIYTIAAFIANVAHETNQLLWRQELASGQDYEGRADLGNYKAGDGILFKGRGDLQTTGRYNYRMFTIWYNKNFKDKEDFEKTPERIAEEHQLSFLAAVYFWKAKNLDRLAEYKLFRMVCIKINGGLNGYDERLEYYNRALLVLSTNDKKPKL